MRYVITYRIFLVTLSAVIMLAGCSTDLPKDVAEQYNTLPEKIDYNRQVKPILSDKCFACHGPDKAKQEAGLRLDRSADAYAALPESPGKVAIDPGNLEGSEFFHRIISNDLNYRMPSKESHLNLSAKEKAILIKWIKQGAVYKPHWAFVTPEKPVVPTVKNTSWRINDIDAFVLQKLEEEKMQPSALADKALLLRRLSFDLTGLPPTVEELDHFLQNKAANAYEQEVDRLLASPHYGEKMAVDWLDLARFSDSHGYTVDAIRDMSPYRDWVIKAFNENFPYDKFIQWQLAGDLMPKPTTEMLVATAFNRLHQQNLEGGIIEDEFKVEYVVDRINTAGTAMMGLTVGCARCHDHKFDPVTQKNYYEMFSFFNNIKEAGQISFDGAMPSPTILLPSAEKEKIVAMMQQGIDAQQKNMNAIAVSAEAGFANWLKSGAYKTLSAEKIPKFGLQGQYNFDKASLASVLQGHPAGVMRRGLYPVPGDPPAFAEGDHGKSLLINGDEWLDLQPLGVFTKSDPFSICISINIPKDFKEGVIFHKSIAERTYNYKGYNLYLRNNKLEFSIAHAAPSNAITKISAQELPTGKWLQVAVTYDGSATAKGIKLFLGGKELAMETTMDQLSKDILLNEKKQPGLQIGGWDRGFGFKGGRVDDIMVYDRVLTDYEISNIAGTSDWAMIAGKLPAELNTTDQLVLRKYYNSAIDAPLVQATQQLQKLRKALSDSTENIPELMVMQEMAKPRQSFLLQRGNYDAQAEKVFPNTPEAILPFPKDLPRNRYGFALWLTNPKHPLTARVAVNRYWQNFFGIGLVKTTEDFGNQGEMPSHPELLDWLAVNFSESGWDVKKLNKLIVLSATYRQSATANDNSREKDRENRLLSHGPAIRLSAEMIRDNALTASGLMNKKIGGKSVKPYQPTGLWEINNTVYQADSGDAVYRRSLYVLVKRSVPNPTLGTFDAPSRSYCVVRRQQTNTPLQALVTLNDPVFVETAKVMGEQMAKENDLQQGIISVYRKLTAQVPDATELRLLTELQQKTWQKFKLHPEKAKGWLTAGQYKVDKNADQLSVAANAVVASVILNSDAALTKR
jgi:Protein of unknown function (DUF1553)/Protein of unknown function (DUF1549)/Concanavalin A-like lectin/glucanases superfamily/Planctomycete cytochrome C